MKVDWLGDFDVIFAGAKINCNNQQKVSSLQRCVMNPSKETFMIPVDSALSEEEQIEAIWYNTTYYHESRHVHDYILCPILNYGYRLRLLSVLHASQVLLKWEQVNTLNFNILPIPIQKWFRLSDDEKISYLNDWSDSGFNAKTSMAFVDKSQSYRDFLESSQTSELDAISSLLLWASGYYETYDSIQRPRYDWFDREYSIKVLMEASAVSSQLAAADMFYGEKGHCAILDTLSKASKDECNWSKYGKKAFTNYTVVLSYIGSYLRYNKTIGYENLFAFSSYLINWCLSGNMLSSSATVIPADRLYSFVENDFAKGITMRNLEDDPIEVFQYWDKKLGCTALDYHNYFSSNREIYDEIANNFKTIGLCNVSEYVEMISKASQIMTSLFFKDPNLYLNPSNYVCNYQNFVNVPVRFILSEPIPLIKSECGRIELEDNLKNEVYDESDKIIHNITIDRPYLYNPNSLLLEPSKYGILSYQKCKQFRPWFQMVEALFKDDSEFDTTIIETMSNCKVRYIF